MLFALLGGQVVVKPMPSLQTNPNTHNTVPNDQMAHSTLSHHFGPDNTDQGASHPWPTTGSDRIWQFIPNQTPLSTFNPYESSYLPDQGTYRADFLPSGPLGHTQVPPGVSILGDVNPTETWGRSQQSYHTTPVYWSTPGDGSGAGDYMDYTGFLGDEGV
jgi:hypothetical protein